MNAVRVVFLSRSVVQRVGYRITLVSARFLLLRWCKNENTNLASFVTGLARGFLLFKVQLLKLVWLTPRLQITYLPVNRTTLAIIFIFQLQF